MESNLSQNNCGFCGEESQHMKACSKCHLTPYCSKQCQRKDWQRHKKWCEILQGNPSLTQVGHVSPPEESDNAHREQGAKVSGDPSPDPIESSFVTPGLVGPSRTPDESPKDIHKKEPDQVPKSEESNGSSQSADSQSAKKKRRKKKQVVDEALPELSKCSWCSKTSGNVLRCSGCHMKTYCSDVCQRRHWIDGHQKTCQKVEQAPEAPKMTMTNSRNGSMNSTRENPQANVCDWCQKCLDSPLRCTGCGKVKYCSKACQKKDWDRQHKRDCERKLPEKKKEPEKSESGKTVNRETKVGKDEDEPIDVCDWCQKYIEAPLKCSGCKKARYCSEGCQKKDWARQHKDNCDKTFVPKKNDKAMKASNNAMPDLDKADEPPISCNWCQKFVEESLPCDGCSRVIYCSKECKDKDWFREHRTLCDGKENKGGAKSKSSQGTFEEAEGSKDKCKNCKKRTRDVKKCARCKIAIYCSKSCQRQDWSRHKEDCITVDGVIKTKQYQKAVNEEEVRARRGDVPMSPLETMAQMMGMFGRPQPEVRPCMTWTDARERTRRRFPGFQVVDNFDELPGEFLWMVPRTYNKVLLAHISSRHHHFARHAVYIKDAVGNETAVMFYLDFDNPLPFFKWSQVAPGNYICIRNAIFHNFMDGSVGIRVDEAADVKILS